MTDEDYEKKYSEYDTEKLKNVFSFINRNLVGYSKLEMRFGEPKTTMEWIKQLNAISDELDKRGEGEWLESSPNNPRGKKIKSNPKKYKDIGEEMYYKYGYGAIEDKPDLIEAYIKASGVEPQRGYAQKGQLYDLMADQSFEERKEIMERISALSKEKKTLGGMIILMSQKEISEARRFGIPEVIIGKMAQGLELGEREKEIVRDHGKVYVRAFKKHEGKNVIKPQIRNVPRGGTHKKGKEHRVEIYSMMGGYYFVIRDKGYKMIYSSPIYKNRSEAKRKSDEYMRKKV